MTKVCFLVSSLCNEGPVNVMYNIIQYMDFSKFKVSIITFIPEKKTTRIKDFQKYPLSIHQLAPETPLNPFALFTALKQEVKLINPDMLHAHCPRSLYLMCFLPRKYKRIYTIHIYPGLQQQILYGKFKGDIVNQLNHFFTRKVDLPIGCSESVGKLYKENKRLGHLLHTQWIFVTHLELRSDLSAKAKKRFRTKRRISDILFLSGASQERRILNY